MSFIQKVIEDCGLKGEPTDLVLSYAEEDVLLTPKAARRVMGLGNEEFNMYQLVFVKITDIENPEDIYICDCKQLPTACCCEDN